MISNRTIQRAQRGAYFHLLRQSRAIVIIQSGCDGRWTLLPCCWKPVGHCQSRRSLQCVTVAKQPALTYQMTSNAPKSGYQRCWSSHIPGGSAGKVIMLLPAVSVTCACIHDLPRTVTIG